MANSTGSSKLAGRLGSLLAVLGVIAFFTGLFCGPRTFAFAGVALMAASMVGFFIEEQGMRSAARK